jgi:hypothetical protein
MRMERSVPPAEPDTFRQLVERKITTEEYVRSLDERVKEQRESNRPTTPAAPRQEPSDRS